MMAGNRLYSRTFLLFSRCSRSCRPPLGHRFTTSRYADHMVKESRDLPWIQHSQDSFKDEPAHHRGLGVLLFRSVLRRAKIELDWEEMKEGLSSAIEATAESIGTHDADDKMQSFLTPTLLSHYRIAFEQLNIENKTIDLEITAPDRFQISGARFILGDCDGQVLNIWGQKIIVSNDDLEELRSNGFAHIINVVRKYGEASKIRFQIDIKFELVERYALSETSDTEYDSTNVKGDRMKVYHRWRLETCIPSSQPLELDWRVADVDDFLRCQSILPEDREE